MKSQPHRKEAEELDARAHRSTSLAEAQALMHRADRLRQGGSAREPAQLPVLRN